MSYTYLIFFHLRSGSGEELTGDAAHGRQRGYRQSYVAQPVALPSGRRRGYQWRAPASER
jgi:hypothetical protein